MLFKILPVEIIQSPNYYSILPDGAWNVYDETSTVLGLLLQVSDSLGSRPYIVSSGDTLQAEFPRSDSLAIQSGTRGTVNSTSRAVIKTCDVDSNNKSLFTISLTSVDISNIISGSMKFTFKYGTVTRTWLESYIVIKKINDVGM